MTPRNVNLLHATGRYSNANRMRMRLEMKGRGEGAPAARNDDEDERRRPGAKQEPPETGARRVERADWAHNLLKEGSESERWFGDC